MASSNKKKKKELEERFAYDLWSNARHGVKSDPYLEQRMKVAATEDDDIAPVKDTSEEKWYEGWFQKGNDDVARTILGTSLDTATDFTTGVIGMGENIVDFFADIAPDFVSTRYASLMPKTIREDLENKQRQARKEADEFIKKDLYDEKAVAKELVSNYGFVPYMKGINSTGFSTPGQVNIANQMMDTYKGYIGAEAYEDDSVLGHKSDSLVQSGGQLAATAALSAAGVPWYLTTGVTTYGGEVENALKQGATSEEARLSAIISAGAEILTEKISGGIKFGKMGTLDDALTKTLSRTISNRAVRTAAKLGMDMVGEGSEEVLSGLMSAIGQKLTYADEKELEEIFGKEDAFEAFIGGAILGAGGSVTQAVQGAVTGVDSVSELTKNEEKVVKKVYKDLVAEAEKNGKVTQKEKAKIYDEVLDQMEKGYISTSAIEEIFGGKTYEELKSTIESENSALEELTGLYEGDELKQQVSDFMTHSKRYEIQDRLSQEVSELVKGDRLSESYRQVAYRGQKFEADLTRYDAKQRETVRKAIESGVLNNTRRTHELVDIIAKISADKGVSFDFTNNEKLKESGFAVDGKTVNGFVTDSGVTVNVQSSKYLNSVVGHEITHVLEGTEVCDALQETIFEYAKGRKSSDSKFDSEYKERLHNTILLYKNVKGYEGAEGFDKIKKEVVADLVGDYLFTDSDFIHRLSTEHRNVFEKIYDEIKYLWKIATAGSQEARELENVKRAFEEAYRADEKNTAEDGGVRYCFGVNEETVKNYIDAAYVKGNKDDVLRYAEVSSRLMNDVAGDVDLTGYTHALRDNDIRHIRNSHGEGTNEKYPVTKEDLAMIPDIVTNYDKVFVKTNSRGKPGVVYVKVATKDVIYYVEAVTTEYHNEKLLVNKQMIKTGISEIPNLHGLQSAINKKESSSQYLADLQEIRKAYVQDVKENYSTKSIPENNLKSRETQQFLSAEQQKYFKDSNGDEGASTVAIAFDSNQIKSVANEKPTSDPDIRFSLSDSVEKTNVGETPRRYGTYNVSGEEVAYAPVAEKAPVQESSVTETPGIVSDDVAPVTVAENGTNAPITPEEMQELFPDDLTPLDAELNRLLREKDTLENRMMDASNSGEWETLGQINTEYETVMKRIAELEEESVKTDSDRANSLENADAPTETERQYEGYADTSPIAKKDVDDIAREAKETLGLKSAQMNDFRKLIEEYSQSEDQSRERLFNDIKEKFGTYKESWFDQSISDAKKYLRTTKLYLNDTIKGDIADFADFKKRNRGKVILSANGGIGVDTAYAEMRGLWPHLFPENIINPTDQLLQMVDIANRNSKVWEDEPIDDNTIWEVANDIADNVAETKQLQKEAYASEFAGDAFDSLMRDAEKYAPISEDDVAPVRQSPPLLKATPDISNAPIYESTAKGVPKGQTTLFEEQTEPERPSTREELHQNIVEKIRTYFAERGFDFDAVLKKAKNLSTFATVDNTPQRVMEKSLGYKEGGILADLTVNKVAQNETEGIKWLNSFTDRKNGLLAQISNQYNIKPGSKESAAAQMYAEGFYVGENEQLYQYGDNELAQDFPDAYVRRNIKNLARDPRIRQIYDETLAAINESRSRNLYPEIPRLDNYFLHFRAMEDTFSHLGLPFNPNAIKAKDLPTDLNGVTADLKPGQPYFASAKHRTGKRTSFDLLGGLERYLTSAKNQIYHIDDIQTLRALRNFIADTYGQAHGLESLDDLSEEEAQERIKEVYNHHLSTFAKFLNEEANVLAGKTVLIDRGLEGEFGRRAITFLDTLNKQVGSNAVGYSFSSAIVNLDAIPRAFVKANKADFVKAFGQMVCNKVTGRDDGFAENSPVIIRRKGAERFQRNFWQKMSDPGYALMSMVDETATELIARAKYNELTRNGMDSQTAHFETDKWVSKLMGDRSLGQQPQLFNSKMLGLLTKFQLEVRNNLDSMFYDSIQEAKVSNEHIENALTRNAKTAAKATATIAGLAVAQHIFGKAFESVAGYNPSFDIIEAVIKAFGWDDDEEEPVLDNIEEAFLSLIEDMPYSSTFTGGRIPIQNALPVAEVVTGKDQYGVEKSRWETLGEIAPYYLLPGGYGQVKKTLQGLGMFSDDHPVAGSYTDNGNLRFPVEDTFGNRLQAGLFGQYASENARDYFDNDRKPLNEKQIQEFKDVGLSIQDYWEYLDGLKGLTKLSEKADYINSLDLTDKQKNVLINNIADREEDIDMSDYDDYGSFEEFDFATKNPGKYAVSRVISDNFRKFERYSEKINAIKAGNDSSSGTKDKELVSDYIFGLDMDYGQKLILFRSQYKSDDTYNYDIIDYLNSRDDISYEEMETILKELGFKVSSDGTITWD